MMSAILSVLALLKALQLVNSVGAVKTCDRGWFSCGNLTGVCVIQRHWCDGEEHCPNGLDEDVQVCEFWYGGLEVLRKYLKDGELRSKNALTGFENDCDLLLFPDFCSCSFGTRLKCSDSRLNFVPNNFPPDVVKLFLQNNSIHFLRKGDFKGVPNLEALHLDNNSISDVELKTFGELSQLSILSLKKNKLSFLKEKTFEGLSSLDWLFLDNNHLSAVHEEAFHGLTRLRYLTMSYNHLTLDHLTVKALPVTLVWLSMESNSVWLLKDDTFVRFPHLQVLNLRRNRIEFIGKRAFNGLFKLMELDLKENSIFSLHSETFNSLQLLSTLFLGSNPVSNLSSDFLAKNTQLTELDLDDLTIENVSREMFSSLTRLNRVSFRYFDYCQYIPTVPNCSPKSDGVTSTENLLDLSILRVGIWIVAAMTFLGNSLVLIGRSAIKDEKKAHSLLIKNLAAADLLLGVYLVLIASHDIKFRGLYNRFAYDWLRSWGCHLTGCIAMISSEVSLVVLTYISVERYLTIVYPYRVRKLPVCTAAISLLFIWSTGVAVAFAPLLNEKIFGRYYGTCSVCFPLHLNDPYQSGWQYSAAVFLGLNFASVAIISFCYVAMMISVLRTRFSIGVYATSSPEDLVFIKRFLLIVATNVACWCPIFVVKIMALANVPLADETSAWLTVFVLPINSALNPFLYSLTTVSIVHRICGQLTIRRRSSGFLGAFNRRYLTCKSSITTTTTTTTTQTGPTVLLPDGVNPNSSRFLPFATF